MVTKLRAFVLVLFIFTALFHATGVFGASQSNYTIVQSIDLDVNNDKNPEFEVFLYNTRSDIKYVVQSPYSNNYKYMSSKTYKIIQYKNSKKTGYINFTVKSASDNRNWMFFVNYYSDIKNIPIKYNIKTYTQKTNLDVLNFAKQNDKYVIKRQKAANKANLPNKVTYLEGGDRYMKFGEIISIRGLGASVYEAYPYNTVNTLSKAKNGFNSEVTLNSVAKREIRANWILSLDRMVDWSNDTAYRTMINLDFQNGDLFFNDGVYRKNMSNYLPRSSTVQTYFKNPSGLQVRACKWVLDKGSLFRTMGVYTMYAFADSIGEAGYVPTQPMSEWLKSDFNIKYNFYDTRFNSDTMSSLIYIYKDYPDKYVLDKVSKYIKFYKNYYKTKQYKVGKAIFVPDYMDSTGKNKINPTALNHFIAEAEVMFQYYQLTGDKESHKIAQEMLNSIKLTSSKWIRSDGDLWYRVTPEGAYKTNDYPLVTYNDLVTFRLILKTVEGKVPPEIEKMYQSKQKWAKSHKYL